MRKTYYLAGTLLGVALYFFISPRMNDAGIANPDSTSVTVDFPLRDHIGLGNADRLHSTEELTTSHLPVDVDEIFTREGGLSYRSIDQLIHNPDLVKQLREDLENFKKYGSIGKGQVTIEFSTTQDLKDALNQKGLTTAMSELAIKPVSIATILGDEFRLVGANTQGKLISTRGWNGFFQTLTDDQSGRQVELSEFQIETRLGDSTEIVTEFLNDMVGNTPAFVQTMKDRDDKNVYSIQWSDGDRSFTLNTKSFDKADSLALASSVLDQYRLLAHEGWKIPYFLDPSNPLHRLAIQRDQQRVKPLR